MVVILGRVFPFILLPPLSSPCLSPFAYSSVSRSRQDKAQEAGRHVGRQASTTQLRCGLAYSLFSGRSRPRVVIELLDQ